MTLRPRSKKPDSLPTLIHELDGIFSRYIRKRDTINGKVICFICGAKMHFVEAQCGHWIDRDQIPTRYDEMNCHALCEDCNCFDTDHRFRYADAMIDKYGESECNRVVIKSKGLQKYMRFELQDLIDFYKAKIKGLAK